MALNQIGARKLLALAGIVGVALSVSACNTNNKNDPLAGGGNLNGSWVSGDGIFTAEFSDGRFVSRANDTGETLTQGSYVVSSADSVQLSWRSQARNEDSVANCAREGVAVLNCTDQAGRTFSLRKTTS